MTERELYERHLVGSRRRPGLLSLYGWRHYHTHDSRRSVAGFPDLVLLRDERLVFAELKRDGEQPTAAQRAWLCALRATGAEVYVWTPADLASIAAVLAR